MEIYDYTHQSEYFNSKILQRYLGGMRLGVFDIETLGLYPKYNPMILAGIMGIEPDGSSLRRQVRRMRNACCLRSLKTNFQILTVF